VAALEPRLRAMAGLACCWLGILAIDGLHAAPGNAVVAALCWFAGTGLRSRALLVEQLRANNLSLEAGRAALAAQALDEERTRLARELHDEVGHVLTIVALQAGAARRIWEREPDKARGMLDTVRATAVGGLRELRAGMTTVDAPRSVAELVARAQAAGLDVTVELEGDIDGEVAGLPVPHQQAVYRVVQEALTNALKHAPGAAVKVSVRRADGSIDVCVTNGAARQAAPSLHRSGHGLAGMRHRLELLGGRLSFEPAPDGGFVVRAHVPLATVTA